MFQLILIICSLFTVYGFWKAVVFICEEMEKAKVLKLKIKSNVNNSIPPKQFSHLSVCKSATGDSIYY